METAYFEFSRDGSLALSDKPTPLALTGPANQVRQAIGCIRDKRSLLGRFSRPARREAYCFDDHDDGS